MNKFTFIDLFAGIGGFHIALKELGGTCVFASEIDKYACATYERNHGMKPHGDITKIDAWDIPDFDILCAGFPCQSFSVAGNRKGFEDTRGTLFFDIARILKAKQPKAFILENVKGLKNHDNGNTLRTILGTLVDCGYAPSWQILNTKDYGLPQNRERIYIVAVKDSWSAFKFPGKQPKVTLSDLFGDIWEKEIAHTIRSSGRSSGIDDKHNWDSYRVFTDVRNGKNVVHSWDIIETTESEKRICEALLKNRRKKEFGDKDGNPLSLNDLKKIIPEFHFNELVSLIAKGIIRTIDGCTYDFVNSKQSSGIDGTHRVISPSCDYFPTITATQSRDKIRLNETIRKLTPGECGMLQGFASDFIIPVSDNQAYKQFGNAVSIPVVKAIAEQILKKIPPLSRG